MPQIEQFTKELNLPEPIDKYLRAVNAGAKEKFPAASLIMDVDPQSLV